MDWAYSAVRPWLFSMDAEDAHRFTLRWAARASDSALGRSLIRARYAPKPSARLKVSAFGLDFDHPVGLAAGLDKDGEAIEAWAAMGFSALELGTVTPGGGQPGNERPRIARLVKDAAVVNRMGFPNGGADALAEKMAARKTKIPVGANLGKAKVTPNEEALGDYLAGMDAVYACSDYLAVNVSSPNTPGLRDLQTVAALEPLLTGILEARDARPEGKKPVLLKIAPDLSDEDVDAVADLALRLGIDGLIATNTTLRHELVDPRPPIAGGLSGAPLTPRALELTKRLYRRLEGKLPIVGVGGIMHPEDAWQRIRAGASLVQLYTGFIYGGPALVGAMVAGLEARCAEAGLASITDAVGLDAV